MNLQYFEYLEPLNLKEALSLLNKHKGKVKIIAGGTEIVNHLKSKNITPKFLLTLKKITSLRGIKENKKEVIIGACTTLKDIINSPVIKKKFKGVGEAAAYVAAQPIQNIATIGGNLLQNTRCTFYNQSELFLSGFGACFKRGGKLCHAVKGGKRCFSVYQGDIAPLLMALDAKVVLEKKGKSRKIPISDLFTGQGIKPFSIADDEVLTKVVLPVSKAKVGMAYEKMRTRGSLEFPFASAAASFEMDRDGVISKARLVIGAAGTSPVSLDDAVKIFVKTWPKESDINQVAEKAYEASEMVNNLSVPALYRKKMVKVSAKRVIKKALQAMKRGE